jgi:hypothetical protein
MNKSFDYVRKGKSYTLLMRMKISIAIRENSREVPNKTHKTILSRKPTAG